MHSWLTKKGLFWGSVVRLWLWLHYGIHWRLNKRLPIGLTYRLSIRLGNRLGIGLAEGLLILKNNMVRVSHGGHVVLSGHLLSSNVHLFVMTILLGGFFGSVHPTPFDTTNNNNDQNNKSNNRPSNHPSNSPTFK